MLHHYLVLQGTANTYVLASSMYALSKKKPNSTLALSSKHAQAPRSLLSALCPAKYALFSPKHCLHLISMAHVDTC